MNAVEIMRASGAIDPKDFPLVNRKIVSVMASSAFCTVALGLGIEEAAKWLQDTLGDISKLSSCGCKAVAGKDVSISIQSVVAEGRASGPAPGGRR
jgi:hypothetical protein